MNSVVKVVGGQDLGETSGKWWCRDARNVPGVSCGFVKSLDPFSWVQVEERCVVLAPLIPLLSCVRKDFRGVGVVMCKPWRRFRLRCKRSYFFYADVDVLLLSGRAGDDRLQFGTSFLNVQPSGGANDISDTNGIHAGKRIPDCFLGIQLEGSRALFQSNQ